MATVFFSAALKESSQDQSGDHKQTIHDRLTFRR